MDSNLKRSAILITVLICITVISIALLSNAGQLTHRQSTANETSTNVSVSNDVISAPLPDSNGFVQIGDDAEAWKRDKGFFDTDETRYAALLLERMKTLSLKAVSVEEDLRVQVLDYDGNPVEGVKFTIQLNRMSDGRVLEYSDDDADGRIVADKLLPGNYEVSLMECEDYLLPEKPLKVSVKEAVEYLLIEDISFLICNDDVLHNEDKMEVSALDNAPKKQNNVFGKNETEIYGIDLSELNGEVDWGKVYKAGIRFAMLRAGYRGAETGQIYKDSKFYENAKAAFRAGLDVGAYFYSQAVTEVEAVEEASALILWCSDLNVDFPLAIRFDRAGGQGRADELSEEKRNLIAEAFCETVKNAGYDVSIYVPVHWIDTNIDSSLFSKYDLWLSDFAKTPTYEGWYDMWQYSSVGKVPGIEGPVYLSLIYNK